MDTTAFIDIRFERIFWTTTIAFNNMRLVPYLTLTSFISLIGTGAAILFLSAGGEDITARDVSWAAWAWGIGAYLHIPLLLWLRGSRGLRCQYCQERPPEKGRFCSVCNERFDLSGAYEAAEKHITGHIQRQFNQERKKGV